MKKLFSINRLKFERALDRTMGLLEREILEAESFGEGWKLELVNKDQKTTLIINDGAFWKDSL